MAGEEFPFPFEPYSVQRDFMRSMYDTIENKKIGIFESPTGTGKSLSIICSVMKWLRDYQRRQEQDLAANEPDTDQPDWVNEQFTEQKVRQLLSEKAESAEKATRRQRRVLKSRKRFKRSEEKENDWDDDVTYSSSESSSGGEEEEAYCTKIFYCSRTHSQLSQLVHEIKKSPYATVKVTLLGSRGNLCINPAVSSLKSNALMNERCLELRQSRVARKTAQEESDQKEGKKKKNTAKCPFYARGKVRDFSTHILGEPQDMESLVGRAREAGACSYYATRGAVPQAEIVLLPYNMILHKDQRKSLNVRLKDSVVIIDEAHNLIETINDIHSVTIHQKHCSTTHRKLNIYLRKVKSRMKPTTLLHCKQVLHCVGLLTSSFKKIHPGQTSPKSYLFTIGDFQTRSDLGDINLFELIRYIRESHLAQKIQGYEDSGDVTKRTGDVTKVTGDVTKVTNDVTIHSRSVLADISSLFTCLTNADSAGRILVVFEECGAFVRYISLNSEDPFLPLLSECRSVLLAGGTMEPIGEVRQQLLNSCSRDVTVFSCGHVIPPEHLLPITLSCGRGQQLNFSFEGRRKPGMMGEVGNVLLEACQIVPGGVVCFFPSYQTLSDCKTNLQSSGALAKISRIKTVFWDEAGSKNSDGILEMYAKRVESGTSPSNTSSNTGAVLMSVLGGRMSEGINFSDDLGRCVLVVGLPFANPADPVLKEKMRYLDNTLASSEEGRSPGQTYYENKCMKSVNQAIGRAIRHKGDYATILLLDHRYKTERINKKLPAWIRAHVRHSDSLSGSIKMMETFFRDRKQSRVD